MGISGSPRRLGGSGAVLEDDRKTLVYRNYIGKVVAAFRTAKAAGAQCVRNGS